MNSKSYEELLTFATFEERFNYLMLHGSVGEDTFGSYRHMNQELYHSDEWLGTRDRIIIRDKACDLACPSHDIPEGLFIVVHHINPITVHDLIYHTSKIFDPNNLITTIDRTHKAIHYATSLIDNSEPVVRLPNDTCPWKK